MRVLLLSLLIGSLVCEANSWTSPSSPFDQYGAIRWEDEQARLDNFAIQLQHWEKALGYILVFDNTGGCPGEATARAIRAKRYLVEYRGIPWNRVIWRREGYQDGIGTVLLIVPHGAIVSYPLRETVVPAVDGPATRACRARLARIKRSRWASSSNQR